ncbi:MAG: hypothetical protein A2V65_12655 [Deltaproteobacteria bacterium RBG_13_49_15]|nr:MAG: hypothetical protein A2V65_12655 [Deltaproteobacteria bacterium RBG_13_49_15]
MPRILVWDFPTRLFHWLLVAFVAISFVTGKISTGIMTYHERSGAVILALILFRFGWGFFGGHYSRFVSFVRGPAEVVRYGLTLFNKDAPKYLGHNPLGGWSILAMLGALLIQVATGLFANDDIVTEGPLYHWVSKSTSDWLTMLHKINQNLIIILVAVHLLAVLFYLIIKRENLIKPMITGFKIWSGNATCSGGNRWAALLFAGSAALLVYLLVR